jgi:hypothetical protein
VRPGRPIRLVISALAVLWVSAPAAFSQTIVIDPDLSMAQAVVPAFAAPRTIPVGIGPPGGTGIGYEGGLVLNTNRTHLIFWQPSGSGLMFDPGYIPLVEQFLGDVAAASHSTSNEYGITGEYYDVAGPAAYASTYGGAVLDTDPLPPNGCTEPALTGPPGWSTCLTDAQLQAELLHVISIDHLPHGQTNIFFLVTPNGFGSCTDSSSSSCALGGSDNGYCGYHSATASGIVYAVIPYNAVSGHSRTGRVDHRPAGDRLAWRPGRGDRRRLHHPLRTGVGRRGRDTLGRDDQRSSLLATGAVQPLPGRLRAAPAARFGLDPRVLTGADRLRPALHRPGQAAGRLDRRL